MILVVFSNLMILCSIRIDRSGKILTLINAGLLLWFCSIVSKIPGFLEVGCLIACSSIECQSKS